MVDTKFRYLEFQYEEGTKIIRHWIDQRYKILQFVGYFNGAILAFAFSQETFLEDSNSTIFISVSALSVLVAMMGLATERSTACYNEAYFQTLREIEEELCPNGERLAVVGIATHGRNIAMDNRFHRRLPVHIAHLLFYYLLILFWMSMTFWGIASMVMG